MNDGVCKVAVARIQCVDNVGKWLLDSDPKEVFGGIVCLVDLILTMNPI